MKKIFALSALAFAMIASLNCTRVGVGEAGIKISNAGSSRGVQDIAAQTGWIWYMPGFSYVVNYPTNVQNAVWTKDPHEGKPVDESITFNSADGLIFNADVNVSYHLSFDYAPKFYAKYKCDSIDTFTHSFMRQQARDEFNNLATKYTAEQIYGVKKEEFVKSVAVRLNDHFKEIGIIVESVGFIGAPRAPQEFTASINGKLTSIQKSQQAENELRQFEADAKKRVAQSRGVAEATLTEAEGQAKANRVLAASLTPELVTYKSIEKWNGELPTYMGGGGPVPFLSVGGKKAATKE